MNHLSTITRATRQIQEAEARQAQAVADAREAGATWAEIAEALGVTRQGAWRRWGHGGAA